MSTYAFWFVSLLISASSCFAQMSGAGVAMATWDPRNFVTHCGIVAYHDPGNLSLLVGNPSVAAGNGISAMSNRVTTGTADLLQGTAANQARLSRADNAGNILKHSQVFNVSPWTLTRMNAFSATDTGATGAGSFQNTTRTLDPWGGNTAAFIQESGDAATDHMIRLSTFPVYPPGSTVTYSGWFKSDGLLSNICIVTITGASRGRYFNLITGTSPAFYSGTSVGYSITAGPNGFYLCSITTSSSTGTDDWRIYSATNSSGTMTVVYNGDNTKGFFISGTSLVLSSWLPVTDTTAAYGYVATTTVPILPGLGGRSVAYFDGAAYYAKTAAFTLNQPTEIYKLAVPWTWTLNHAAFDGNTLNSGKLYQSATSPNIRYTAGTVGTELVAPPLGTWRMTTVVFDGANSRISTNNGAFAVSDAGAGNMGGLTVGAAGTTAGTFWNGLWAQDIVCNKTNKVAEGNWLRWGGLKQAGLY